MADLSNGPLIRGGGDLDRVAVSLRVRGDKLHPEEISRRLGVSPTFAASKGEVRSSGGRRVIQPTGVWLLELSGAPEEWAIGDAIGALLSKLPDDPAVWTQLRISHRLDVFCSIHLTDVNRGFAIPCGLMRELAVRHLDLDMDIYCLA